MNGLPKIHVYENPETSETADEFASIGEALKHPARRGAEIIRNGEKLAVVGPNGGWLLTREGVREFVYACPRGRQRQDSLVSQLQDLRVLADRLGLYDASDLLTRVIERGV